MNKIIIITDTIITEIKTELEIVDEAKQHLQKLNENNWIWLENLEHTQTSFLGEWLSFILYGQNNFVILGL